MIWSPGKTLKNGLYTIESVLRERQLSVMYLARTKKGDRVVIKTPNDAAIPRADFEKLQDRFYDEAWKLKDCQKSPYVARVEAPFKEDGYQCIPMEYIDGTSLDLRNPDRLPEDEAVQYVRQVGEALGVIHAQGLIHRDVTPNNIMRRSRNNKLEAVLIDFGLARDFNLSTSVTSTQKVTPFTAPELCLTKRDRGPFTDLYGLGAMLYTLVTGMVPPMALDRKPDESDQLVFPAGVSEEIEQAIEAAMKWKSSSRPASVAEWLVTLPKVNELEPQRIKPYSR